MNLLKYARARLGSFYFKLALYLLIRKERVKNRCNTKTFACCIVNFCTHAKQTSKALCVSEFFGVLVSLITLKLYYWSTWHRCWHYYRRKTLLVIGGTQTQILADIYVSMLLVIMSAYIGTNIENVAKKIEMLL